MFHCRSLESYSKLSFYYFEAYFFFFSFHLIELLFGRVLASVSEAQLRLCYTCEASVLVRTLYFFQIKSQVKMLLLVAILNR